MTALLIILASIALLPPTYSTAVRLAHGAKGEYIEVQDRKIHYIEKGQGKTLLLVHGLNGAADNFSYSLIEVLAKDYNVIAIDRPGSGYSERGFDEQADLQTQAKHIANFIKAKNIHPILVGHSLGGAISLQTALDYPELVKGLALISPLTQMQTEIPIPFQDMAIRSDTWREAYARSLQTPKSLAFGLHSLNILFAPEKAPFDFSTKGGGLVALDYKSFYHASKDLASLEFSLDPLIKRYGELKTPISIIYGSEDHILSPKLHAEKAINDIKHAKLTYINGGGHLIIVTRPNEIKSFIDNFVSETKI